MIHPAGQFRQWAIKTAGGILIALLAVSAAHARDAAFLDPGAGTSTNYDEAIKVEPKSDIDTGESIMNVARRTTIFFVNQTAVAVHIEKIAVNGDGNVAAELTNDDCTKQGSIPPLSRCSVEISVTPTSPGAWSVETLMTHDGAGRIARSRLSGKTSGATADKKDNGLALNSKESTPVNFGEIEVGAKAVRSALMVNDSPDTITLYSIDVIEAENGLQKLEQGCAVDMELKPGESCPVTLLWQPSDRGQISTDLIIRHSGRMGFAVIPIRGSARGSNASGDGNSKSGKTLSADSFKSSAIPAPPSAQDLERVAANHIPSISADALSAPAPVAGGSLRLIGTVGNRAVLLKPDGTTEVGNVGDEFEVGAKTVKLIAIGAKSADVQIDGKKKTLILGAAPELTSKAVSYTRQAQDNNASSQNALSPSGVSSSSSVSNMMPVYSSGTPSAAATGTVTTTAPAGSINSPNPVLGAPLAATTLPVDAQTPPPATAPGVSK